MKFYTAFLLCFLTLSGCNDRPGGSDPAPAPDRPWWASVTPETIFYAGAAAFAALSLVLVLAGIGALIFGRASLAPYAFAGAALCGAAAPLIAFVGGNLFWLGVLAACGFAGAVFLWARKNIGWIEKVLGINLNSNPVIGE